MMTTGIETKRKPPARRAAAETGTLSADELQKLDALWRASNYLSVGQIYLLDNPLLREPLKREHVKACWFMPNFQNPLGALMPVEQKKRLVRMLARNEIPLIEDDVYGELYFGLRRPPPAKAFDEEGWVMHCS